MKKQCKKALFALLMSCMALLSHAQQRTVTGTVMDDQGTALPNVSYIVKSTSTGGVTGEDGTFSATISSNADVIEFSSVGYATQAITVGANTTLSVIMKKSEGQMEGVVVTAMGIKRAPKQLGYAVSTVEAKDLTKTGSPNFAGALYGKAPGVRISAAPGGATSGININIRGINSITGNSQPLVVIDGVIMRQNAFNNADYWGDQRARGNGLEDLNPEDIASISILKGASAAALYGSDALNGVVLVNTKSGKGKSGFTIDFNANYTNDRIAYLPRFQNVRGPGALKHVQNAGQADDGFFYYDLDNDGTAETRGVSNSSINFGPKFDGQPVLAWDGVTRPYSAQNAYKDFFQNGNSTNFNLAVSHSSENSNTRFSLTRQDNQMTSLGSKNERNIANLNSTFKIGKKLTTDVVVNFINQYTHNRPFLTDRLINNFTGMISPFDNPNWYLNKYKTSLGYKYVTGTGQSLTPDENIIRNGYKTDVLDYIWNIKANQYDEKSNRLIGSFTTTYQITSDLSLRGRFSADATSMNIEDKKPNTRPIIYGPSGFFSIANQNNNVYYADVLANYSKKLSENFTLGAIVGYTATKSQEISVEVNTGDENTSGLSQRDWFDLKAAGTRVGTNDRYNYRRNFLRDAVFATINGNLKDYWFVEGTIRRERVSTMYPDNNTLYYPSVNSSLILSEAFELPQFISYAKLRGSYGIVGKYPEIYASALSYTQNSLGTQGDASPIYTILPTSSFGNEDIKPENKHEVEFGLETRLFKNRLGLDITYYNGLIKDQILNLTIPISSGASSILANAGSLRNRGWEFAISGYPVSTPDFKWNSILNFSMNKNTIEELPNGEKQITHSTIDGDAAMIVSRVGHSMGDIMVRPVAKHENGSLLVGSDGLYELDGSVDGWIKAGNAMPKAVGGFINNFSYKNFTLDLLVDFRLGGHAMPTGINWMKSRGLLEETLTNMDAEHGGISYYLGADGKGIATNGNAGPNGETVYHDGMLLPGVTVDGQENTNVVSQAYYYWNIYNWGGPQYQSKSRYELYVEKNNYFKMREISLGYRLPNGLSSKLRAKNIQLSVYGRNLFFIYRTIKDLDPEQMTAGSYWVNQVTNAGTSPATRSFGVMLRATF